MEGVLVTRRRLLYERTEMRLKVLQKPSNVRQLMPGTAQHVGDRDFRGARSAINGLAAIGSRIHDRFSAAFEWDFTFWRLGIAYQKNSTEPPPRGRRVVAALRGGGI
jgi:hypothetical protein